MDNNQQSASQPSGKPTVENATLGHTEVSQPVTNLGVNEPKTMSGNSVQSPLSGSDVSMTTGQPYGGPIASTEVEPNVRREAGPY
jgi:hypothetical protein